MADYLPPLVASLMLNAAQFKAGLAEAGAVAKAETTGMGTAFNGLATIGKAALIGTVVATVAVGVASVKMAADYESATNRLVTSAGEQRSNLELVRTGMLQMAGDVGTSAMDLAAGMYVVESAGFHAADGLTVLRASAEGAKTENADLAVVANAVTSALIDYHRPASDAALVTSQLVAAVGQGKTTFGDLTGSLHSVLPDASAAHLKFTEIIADVASMTVHGESADQATQNLDHTIQHLTTTTPAQNKEFALLGLNARDLSSNLGERGLAGTLQLISDRIRSQMGPDGQVILDMQTALRGLPPAAQAMGAAVIDGSVSLGAFTKEAKGLSVEQAGLVHQFASLMTSTHGIGSAQKSGAELAQNYAAALKAATGDSTTLSTALMLTGENAAYTNSAIKTVSGATTEAGGHVAGWASIQATLNQHVDHWRYGLEATAIALGMKLIPYVIQAMGAIEGLVGWLGQHRDVVVAVAAAIAGPLMVAMAAYIASLLLAAPAAIVAAAPLIILVAAIALVSVGIALLVMHWNQVRVALLGAAATITNAINQHRVLAAVILALTGPIGWLIAAAALVITHWNQVVAAARWLGAEVSHSWQLARAGVEVVLGFLASVPGRIGAFFSAVGTLASKGWAEFSRHPAYWIGYLVTFIPVKLFELQVAILGWFAGVVLAALKWAYDMQGKADNMALGFMEAIGRWWTNLPDQVWSLLSAAVPMAVKAALALSQAWNDEVGKLPGQMWTLGVAIVEGLFNGFMSMSGWLTNQINQFLGGLIDGAKAALGIHSPSAVMAAEVGVPIAEGVAMGIRQGAPATTSALSSLVSGFGGGSLGVAVTGAGGSALVAGAGGDSGSEDVVATLMALYHLLDDRLPRRPAGGFSTAAYGSAR